MMAVNSQTGEPQEESDQETPDVAAYNLEEFEVESDVDSNYSLLDDTLDKINSCLDALEQKNDTLHEELHKLLEENKQIRSELKQEARNSS